MKITITVEIPSTNQVIDIRVDQKQRIKTTLRVLAENRRAFSLFQNVSVVRIKESGRRISTEKTYEEAFVYTGTQIVLEDI